MNQELLEIKKEVFSRIDKAPSIKEIEIIRIAYLGKKGKLTLFLRDLRNLPQEEKPRAGKLLNQLKQEIDAKLQEVSDNLKEKELNKKISQESIDVTLPGKTLIPGSIHPLRKVAQILSDIFLSMGFSVYEGPEIETDFYNFSALNIPLDHPATDMWDSFYLKKGVLLRSHTSPVQIRVMQQKGPPLRAISFGKCYRRDAIDATHSWMFHQLEGFMADEFVTFSDLKGVLIKFAQALFGKQRVARFSPAYFPFTEPSVEMEIDCFACSGRGCSMCKQSGWIEIMGAGMIHPNVLRNVNYDPEKFTGFAFGLGIERVAMLKYGIDDIRLFFENDKRFLHQFL